MAKKSIRLLSLLLAVLMLISMVPMAIAETADTDVITDPDHREILYDKLVGEANQKNPTYDVYVVDDNWEIKEVSGVKTVTFNFRGQAVTEIYDETRHLANVDAVYTQAAADGVTGSKIPVCILTEGNYSTQIKLKTSIWLLGAKAGYNPVVPSAGVDVAWDMSAERKLPDIASTNTQGETRIWAGLGLAETSFGGMDTKYNDMTLKLVNTTQTAGDQEYVLDGIVFQGYGATLADTGAGSGSRSYFLQNVIFNNGYSYDCDQIRFWNRSGNFTASKSLNIYNSYLTGNNNLGFYSGHASKIQVNGLCAQNNYAYLFRAQTMQVQGFRFEMTNSHFWRSSEFASDTTPRNAARNDYILRCDYNAPANNANQIGNNTEAYHYAISNSTFWNTNSVTNSYGDRFQNSGHLFMIGMAGTDEKIIMEGNVFGSDFTLADGVSRHPLQIVYLKDSKGNITHAATAISYTTATDQYALTSDMVQIHNNTFISNMYQNTVPNIGNNTAPGTKIEMTGNFHAESLATRNGTYTVGSFDDVVYDKWVYLKNTEDAMTDPKNKTNYLNEDAFSFDTPDETLVENGGNAYTIDTDAKEVKFTYTAGADSTYTNYVEVYEADSSFNKLANVTGSATETTVEFSNAANYYVVSLLSCDKRTAVDHYITINRSIQDSAKLEGIIPADEDLVKEENLNTFYYELDYAAETFEFTLDVPEATGSFLYAVDAEGNKVTPYIEPKAGTHHTYVIELEDLNTVYEYALGISLSGLEGVFDEEYSLSFLRRYCSITDISDVSVDPGDVTKNALNNTFTAAVGTNDRTVRFTPAYHKTATLQVIDVTYNKDITNSTGKYVVTDLKAGEGENLYQLIVTAQDGTSDVWTLAINRPADTNANLKTIHNAAKGSDGNYSTNVTTDKFIVDAEAESAAAKVEIFADEACTDKILDPAITLLNKSVNVWIKVTAEANNSTVTKLTINTTTTGSAPGGNQNAMVGNGIIGITGATAFDKDATEIVVNLGTDAEKYAFKAIGLSGYSVAIYGDAKHTLWAPTEMTIKPDSGLTYLYAVAKSPDGKDVRNYKITIKTFVTVKYTDSAVEWAKAYVNKMSTSGMGYIKGNEHGQFNGEANLNRYEMATMMVRITGANKDLYSNVKLPFRDLDTVPEWALNYVKAAYRIGLVGGHAILDDAGKVIAYEYKGEDNATRSEFLKVFMNAMYGEDVGEIYKKLTQEEKDALAKKITDKKFADQADIQEWAIPYVYYAINDGIIKGAGDRINPDMNITRFEAAAIICRKYFGMA